MAVPAVGCGIGGSRGTGYERLRIGHVPHRGLCAMKRVTWNAVERLSIKISQPPMRRCGALEDQVRVEREKVALLQDKLAQRVASLDELSALADRENEANVLLRRAERAGPSSNRRLDIDVQADRSRAGRMGEGDGIRSVGGVSGVQPAAELSGDRRVGRPGRRGEVRLIEAATAAGTPGDRRRRSPGEADPVPVSKSLRIFVSEDVWPVFVLTGAITAHDRPLHR